MNRTIWNIITIDYTDYFIDNSEEYNINNTLEECAKKIGLDYKLASDTLMITCSENLLDKIEELKIEIKKELSNIFIKSISRVTAEYGNSLSITIPNILLILEDKINDYLISNRIKYGKRPGEILSPDKYDYTNLLYDIKQEDYHKIQFILERDLKNMCRKMFINERNNINLNIAEKDEIIFSMKLRIDDSNSSILDILAQCDGLEIFDQKPESEYLRTIDYNPNTYNQKFLVHNIRKEEILILRFKNIIGANLFFLGFIKLKDNEYEITIKSFEYQVLNKIFDYLSKKTSIVMCHDNLNWEFLLRRKVRNSYRDKDKHILDNQMMKDFLKETKKDFNHGNMVKLLNELTNKGYFSEKEYAEYATEKAISKFLIKYIKIDKNYFKEDKSFWISSESGKVYKEESKTAGNKIKPAKKTSIYSPNEYLLYYIRTFWHQQFTVEVLKDIKSQWDKDNNVLRIKEILSDIQFDFKNTEAKDETKDIDVLIRVVNESLQEFIIAIEAKQNSSEYSSERKEIPKKIDRRFACIFNGFIFIAYFGKENNENNILHWKDVCCEHDIKRGFLPCVDTNYKNLIKKTKMAITKICNEEIDDNND